VRLDLVIRECLCAVHPTFWSSSRSLRSEAARDTPDDAYNVQSARSTEEAKPAHAMGLFDVHVE
jgi:hypothetical protein